MNTLSSDSDKYGTYTTLILTVYSPANKRFTSSDRLKSEIRTIPKFGGK